MRTGVDAPPGTKPLADPRRRRGVHGQARQMLADDGRSLEPINQAWRGLVSALQRHTLEAALAALHEEERFVLSLAYLEGRTNREIATLLSVSVSTVGRRLTSALAQLEQQLSRAGAVVSAGVLLALGYLGRRLAVARAAKLLAPSTSHGVVVLTAASTAGAIALGLLVMNAPPSISHRAAPVVPAARAPAGPVADGSVQIVGAPIGSPPGRSNATLVKQAELRSTSHDAAQPAPRTKHGCGGKPTNAPPVTPVGRHSGGAPVTHPTAGGCGPHV